MICLKVFHCAASNISGVMRPVIFFFHLPLFPPTPGYPFSPQKLMINVIIHLWKDADCLGKRLVIIWSFLKPFLSDFILLKVGQVSFPPSVPGNVQVWNAGAC